MIVSLVPVEYIDREWDHVANLISKAVQRSGGRWDIGSVYEEVKAGYQQLFIVYDEDKQETKAAWTSKFLDYPGAKSLQTIFIGGSGYDEWFDEVNDFIKRWASENDCKFVEFIGRKGWERKLKKIGWTSEYYSYRMEIQLWVKAAAVVVLLPHKHHR